jgi:hypothetical protein
VTVGARMITQRSLRSSTLAPSFSSLGRNVVGLDIKQPSVAAIGASFYLDDFAGRPRTEPTNCQARASAFSAHTGVDD